MSFCCKSHCLVTLSNTGTLLPIVNPALCKQNSDFVRGSFVFAFLLLLTSFFSEQQSLFVLTWRSCPGVLLLSCHFLCICLCIYLSLSISLHLNLSYLSVSLCFICLSIFLSVLFSFYSFYFVSHEKHTTQYTDRVCQLGSFVVGHLAEFDDKLRQTWRILMCLTRPLQLEALYIVSLQQKHFLLGKQCVMLNRHV